MNKVQKKLFTIIILSYNNLEYMEECLESVLEQDYPYIEVIISDDCSEKFEQYNIDKYIKNNKNDNIVNFLINRNSKNLGVVKNINSAIKISSGEYIMNLSCDDKICDKKVISDIVNYFNKINSLAVTGFIKMYDENLIEAKRTYPKMSISRFINNNEPIDIYLKLCKGGELAGPGFTYKRELIDKYGLYDEEYKLIDDYPRYLYLTRNGCSISFINRILVKYRDGGITNQIKSNKNSEIKRMIWKDLQLVKAKEIKPYIKK